ncbi:hypothetical protein ARMGADRAFT_1021802 [Armillaria gallica]|uniref:Uncharacterized protein n=1 Tax=Armillaria gallica TaxID=47427 RepID=A0A2H3EWS3_ARMGA|nr:hypothetical protein ARMGADRAFT_1021802 [Armillaria gallica]
MCAFKFRYTHSSSLNVGRHSGPCHHTEMTHRLPASSDLVCEMMALGYMNQDPGNDPVFSRMKSLAEPMSGAHYANFAEPNPWVIPLFHLKDSRVKTLWSQSPAGACYLSSKILKSRPFMANLLYGNMAFTGPSLPVT